MKKKIAKRYKRMCIRGGMKIVGEHFTRCGKRRKDCGVVVHAEYCGWSIAAISEDYLSAYKMLYYDMPEYEEMERERKQHEVENDVG